MKQIVENVKPVVKWVGGKRFLAKTIEQYMPLKWNNYHEPFLGGGAIFCHLFNSGLLTKKKVFLNDKNPELMNLYFVLQDKDNYEKIIAELERFEYYHSKEEYYKVRSEDRDPKYNKKKPLYKAARFIYLNKTCFNGLCRFNSRGEFNAPFGDYENPKIVDKEGLWIFKEALQGVKLFCEDFDKVLVDNAKKNDFVYLDPPYFPISKTSNFTSYTNTFEMEEQKRLFKTFQLLDKKNVFVIESNSNTDFIKELYKGYKIYYVDNIRTVSANPDKRKQIKELLITNY